jgi:hypothetical protein
MLADCSRWAPHFPDQSESVSLFIVFFFAAKEMMIPISAFSNMSVQTSPPKHPSFLSGAIP